MSDSSNPLGTIALGQGDQSAKANALFDAVFSVAVFAKKAATTSGLTLGFHGGKINVNGTVTAISDGTVALAASSTNYVEANPATGAVSKNTVGYTPGYWRLGRAVTGTGTITTWYDDRTLNFGKQTRLLVKTYPSDANYTLTADEADVDVIKIAAGTITAARNLVVPIAFPHEWVVINATAYAITVIGSTGTGVPIAAGKTATVMADGTNVVRITADV